MRPDCVSACIEYVTYMERQMDEQTDKTSGIAGSQNTFVDRLIQSRISPWPNAVLAQVYRADGWTDGQTLS